MIYRPNYTHKKSIHQINTRRHKLCYLCIKFIYFNEPEHFDLNDSATRIKSKVARDLNIYVLTFTYNIKQIKEIQGNCEIILTLNSTMFKKGGFRFGTNN